MQKHEKAIQAYHQQAKRLNRLASELAKELAVFVERGAELEAENKRVYQQPAIENGIDGRDFKNWTEASWLNQLPRVASPDGKKHIVFSSSSHYRSWVVR
ncbi:MAG: hypothetical protein F6J97_08180 [Leptolyngbya sp. SIO4C1]|nr:hypothetical protein [Leptolyngbya sp. SIO4C1]